MSVMILNETLLDNVEGDDVNDNDAREYFDVNLSVYCSITFPNNDENDKQHKCYEKNDDYISNKARAVLEHYSNAGLVSEFSVKRSDRSNIHFKMSGNSVLYDFCMLFVKMFLPRHCFNSEFVYLIQVWYSDNKIVSITNGMDESFDRYKTLVVGTSSDICNLIMRYFPDETEDEIERTFIRAYVEWQRDEGVVSVVRMIDSYYSLNENIRENIIDKSGNLVFDEWITDVLSVSDGIAIIKKGKYESYYDIAERRTFMSVYSGNDIDCLNMFSDGLGCVVVDSKCKFVDKNGNYVFGGKEFSNASCFDNGYAIVWNEDDDTYNIIDKDGNLVSEQWFGMCHSFKDGLAAVVLNNSEDEDSESMEEDKNESMYNYIDTRGNLISEIPFSYADDFIEGFGIVSINSKGFNYMDRSGNLISDKWFDSASPFSGGFGIVSKHGKSFYNYIKPDGTFLLDHWYDKCYDFKNGFGIVKDYKKFFYVDSNGNRISDSYYDICFNFCEGFAVVCAVYKSDTMRRCYNYIDTKGEFLYKDGMFMFCYDFENGLGLVMVEKGKYNYLDKNGKLVLKECIDDYMQLERVSDSIFKLNYGDGSCVDLDGEMVVLV